MEQSGAYAVPQGGFEIIEAAHGSGYSLRSSQDSVKKCTFLSNLNNFKIYQAAGRLTRGRQVLLKIRSRRQ